MSSPLNFPSSDDIEMDTPDEQPQPQATPARDAAEPLFLQGTPSATGTPARRGGAFMTPGSVARRAVGLETPRNNRTPLFARGSSPSSPLNFPSSSPVKSRGGATPRRRVGDSDVPDSSPLFFPSTPSVAGETPRQRRGDIHSSLTVTPTRRPRQAAPRPPGAGLNTDLSSDGTHLSIPASSAPNLSMPAEPSDEPDEIRAIWGTTVNLEETMNSFKEFLRGFKIKYRVAYDRDRGLRTRTLSSPAEGEELLYEGYLRTMRRTGQNNLNLDMVNLLAYPPSRKLHGQLVKYPQEVIPAMDTALKDVMMELLEEDRIGGDVDLQGEDGDRELANINTGVFKIRPFGLPAINLRDLNPTDTDKLVCIKGLVIRATPVIPDMTTAFFRCLVCNHTRNEGVERGKINEPLRCPRETCGSIGTMSLIHNRCWFADRQVIRLQETPDAVPDGQTPHTVTLSAYDELVDVSKPGDRLMVTGIFRSVPVRINPRQRTLKSLFKTFVDIVHVRLGAQDRMGHDRTTRGARGDGIPGVGAVGDFEEEEQERRERDLEQQRLREREDRGFLSQHSTANGDGSVNGRQPSRREQMEAKLKELGTRPDIYEYLARSLAPSIWALEDVKKGILLQLFGGTNKNIAKGGGGDGPRYRGDINVLLVGDPGTSKSQILQYVHKIAPRGVYTSGKGSSAVGLTAYVTRDPDSKQLVLESGALVLSDGGVCCIDEFDKMSDATRSVLHEVMEQQTVSIAKAGIITTLNARTSILAAANPIGSKYNPAETVTKNIDLPPTLISRFDLLYLVLDQVDEQIDRKLAQHLVGLYLEDAPETGGEDVLPLEDLAAYISFARTKYQPSLDQEAQDELVRCYVILRKAGEDPRSNEKRITATTRQLESMIRLSEAHARMRLSTVVELQDVKEAYRLMREAINTSARDPTTGEIDMGLLDTGIGRAQRRMRGDMRKAVLGMLDGTSGTRGVRWAEAFQNLEDQSTMKVTTSEFQEVIKELEQEGLVKVVGDRERRMIRRVDGA